MPYVRHTRSRTIVALTRYTSAVAAARLSHRRLAGSGSRGRSRQAPSSRAEHLPLHGPDLGREPRWGEVAGPPHAVVPEPGAQLAVDCEALELLGQRGHVSRRVQQAGLVVV